MKKPIKIAITGSGGNIGYALVFRIATGEVFGPDQAVDFSFVEIKSSIKNVEGLMFELEDCASPIVHDMKSTLDVHEGFRDVDYAILIGAKPRGPGMERKDLLQVNGEIFKTQGRALNEAASRNARVVVVGNPVNTNTLIAIKNAPELPASSFSCLLRLDHNRAVGMLARKLGCAPDEIRKVTVWGNHSSTQFPDLQHCEAAGRQVIGLVDDEWRKHTFVPEIQQRGARIIQARKASSAASAASAIIDHVKTLRRGTAENDWTSMGVLADGDYGIKPGIVFSYPVTTRSNTQKIVQGLKLDDYSREMIRISEAELCEEREAVKQLLK